MRVDRRSIDEMGQRFGAPCRHLPVLNMKLLGPPRESLQHLHTTPTEDMSSEHFSLHLISSAMAPAFKCSGSTYINGAVMKLDLLSVRGMDLRQVGTVHTRDWYLTRRAISNPADALLQVCFGGVSRFLLYWERICSLEFCSEQSHCYFS